MTQWSHEDIPDQSGRTVIVTGANRGLGFEATKAFASKGAHVVMACRSLDKGHSAREEIRDSVAGASLTVMELDLADLDSVRSFAETFEREHASLHVLANNAAVMVIPRDDTADGFEKQFGVNHLGHFALTGRLLDQLRETPGETRVVTQSSGLHERGAIHFDDLQLTEDYDKWTAYAQSKLANVLFAYELDRRLRTANASVTSVACHPGFAATDSQSYSDITQSIIRKWGLRIATAVFAQSPTQGALPLLYAATAPDVDGGDYVGPGGLFNIRGAPEKQLSSEQSYDEACARRLWDVSGELTGVSYGLPVTASTKQ